LPVEEGRERKGKRRGRWGRRCPTAAKERKGREGGGRRPDGRVPLASEREREEAGRARAARPMGLVDRKVRRVCFLFFFSFSNFFLNNFSFQIQTKFFQTFSQKFYKLFRSYTSNQKPCKAN
jgi:hypothetical protein